MDISTLTIILTALQGPASSIVVCFIMLYGFGWVLIKHILPKQDLLMEKFLQESKEARLIFQHAVDVMASRLIKLDDNVVIIGENIKEVEKDVETIKKTIAKINKD